MAFLRLFNCFQSSSDPRSSLPRVPPKSSSITATPEPSYSTPSSDPFTDKSLSTTIIKTSASSSETEVDCSPANTAAPHHSALIITSSKRYELVQLASAEILGDEDVVISTRAVGLNPIDWKSVDFNFCMPEFPWVNGREMAGVVQRVGKSVTDVKPGDRVWTGTYYRKREAGCFQTCVTVPTHTVLRIPPSISFESAACLGVPGLTAAMTLWHWLEIPMPATAPTSVPSFSSSPSPSSNNAQQDYLLIWGGSTITGQFAIQFARLSGLAVIAITSLKTRALASRLGAAHVITRDAIDIVGPSTAALALSALSTTREAAIAPLSFLPDGAVVPKNVVVKNVEMKRFILDTQARRYALELNRLLARGEIELPRLEVLSGGLEAVPEGLERLRRGDMEGRKLVVSVKGE